MEGRRRQTSLRWTTAAVRLTWLIGALMAAGPGCGLFSRSQNGVPSTSTVLVEVESHNWNDITVYLVAGGLPQRLGKVSALGEASFDFPSHRLNTSLGIRLRALPLAGQAFTSEPILVQPGQVITWILENDLDRSSHAVY